MEEIFEQFKIRMHLMPTGKNIMFHLLMRM